MLPPPELLACLMSLIRFFTIDPFVTFAVRWIPDIVAVDAAEETTPLIVLARIVKFWALPINTPLNPNLSAGTAEPSVLPSMTQF